MYICMMIDDPESVITSFSRFWTLSLFGLRRAVGLFPPCQEFDTLHLYLTTTCKWKAKIRLYVRVRGTATCEWTVNWLDRRATQASSVHGFMVNGYHWILIAR